ncbi:histidine phosphatase family protein [soil metagenome]
MRLLLIRHGQTPANVRGALETARPGPRLTELGREQAAAIPDALAGEQIAAIYVSPLIRTSDTAGPLATSLGLDRREREGLQEVEAGRLEGRTDKRAIRKYMGTIFAWADGQLERAMPGGPTGREFFRRFDAALSDIAADHASEDTIVVVSHGAAIRVWASSRSRNLPDDYVKHHQVDNTGIVALDGSPTEGWIAETWGGEPVGGAELGDPAAPDPTGDATTSPVEQGYPIE